MEESSAVVQGGLEKTAPLPRYAWVVLAVVFLAGVAAPLNQSKVSPLLTILMTDFQVNLSTAGLLTSVFAITGFVLALPAGIIVQRLGLKVSGLIAMGCLVIGSALGAIAPNYSIMLASRAIEGAGLGLIAVVGPASIALWFPPERQGLPMGVWGTWIPAGMILSAILGPALATASGWQSVWWFCAGFGLVVFLLILFLMRTPENTPVQNGETGASLLKALANRDLWLLALTFTCFNLTMTVIPAYYPTFLSTARGYSTASASTSLIMITTGSLISCLAVGALIDKLGSRKRLLMAAFLIISILLIFPFTLPDAAIPVWMVAAGAINGALAVTSFSAVPPVMDNPQRVGIGTAVLIIGQNIGQFVGMPIFGALVEKSGWVTAGYWLIPVALLGLIVSWFIKIK